MRVRRHAPAFTLIEVLTSIAIMGLLVGILVPYLRDARAHTKRTVCQTRLRMLGHGMAMYANQNRDYLMPGRMPRIDDERWSVEIEGGMKYRPTFLAVMGSEVGVAPFDDPLPTKGGRGRKKDRHGEPADRQDYATDVYLCPEEPEWTDERNGAFGYNYQFLGNARLLDKNDERSFKNWPIAYSRVRAPSSCVAVADGMGTAATFPPRRREEYDNNGRNPRAFGDEGFNLDPPLVDPVNGEMAGLSEDATGSVRTALHERHLGKANVLWVDGHVSPETNKTVGYEIEPSGAILFGTPGVTSNRLWTVDRSDGPWVRKR